MEYDENIVHTVTRKYRLTADEFNLALREFIERKTGHKLPLDTQFDDYYRRGGVGVSLDRDLWDGVQAEVVEEKVVRKGEL